MNNARAKTLGRSRVSRYVAAIVVASPQDRAVMLGDDHAAAVRTAERVGTRLGELNEFRKRHGKATIQPEKHDEDLRRE